MSGTGSAKRKERKGKSMTATVLPTQLCFRRNAEQASGGTPGRPGPRAPSPQLLSLRASHGDEGIGWRRRTVLVFHYSAGKKNAF